MPIQNCPTHQLPQTVICCEGDCLRRYCSQCFLAHNQQHATGVILNQTSKKAFIDWNLFLIQKFKSIQSALRVKGSNTIFEMKLNSNYPKGLINQLSNAQIVDITIKIIDEYLETLSMNIQYVSAKENLNQLDNVELYKDLFIFFVYDAGSGLNFLLDKVKSQLQQKFSNKKIYDYIEFVFVPKELRQIQISRKQMVKNVQDMSLIITKKNNPAMQSPKLARSRASDKQKQSPKRSKLLSGSNRMRPYSENISSQITQPSKDIEKSVAVNKPQQSSVGEQKTTEFSSIIIDKKIQQQMSELRKEQQLPNQTPSTQTTEPNKPEIRLEQQSQKQPTQHKTVQQQANPPPSNQSTIQQAFQTRQQNSLQELYRKIKGLQEKVKQRQRSIRQLNNLIGNEEEQILYRQNEVEILNQEIKKLLVYKEQYESVQKELKKVQEELKLKERSITELNKLIGNEEEQLQFRESQVETLTTEIKKLVQWKSRCQEIQRKLNEKEKELDLREKGIKQLNNVIGNEEEELAFRQNQVQMLTSELKKTAQAKAQAQKKLQQAIKQNEQLKKVNSQLQISLQKAQSSSDIKNEQNKSQAKNQSNFDEQLMEQVIDLESQVVARNEDIKTLVNLINSIQNFIPNERKDELTSQLKKLRTTKLEL